MTDIAPKARAKRAPKTHCSKGHELTPDNLVKKSLPRRTCLKCTVAWLDKRTYGYDKDDDWLYLDYDE